MAEFLASGRAIDCILALMFIELLALIFVRRKSGRGLPLRDVLASLCAGAALLLAVRAALRGSPWQWISLWLIAALLAHLLDLSRRWKSAPAPGA